MQIQGMKKLEGNYVRNWWACLESCDGSKGLYMLRADNAATQSATSTAGWHCGWILQVMHQW